MKKFIILTIILVGCVSILRHDISGSNAIASDGDETGSKAGKFFAGEHELLPISYYEDKNGNLKEAYVTIRPHNTSTSHGYVCTFMWRSNSTVEEEYIISSMWLEDVKFIFDSYVSKPIIKFRWKSQRNTRKPSGYINSCVIYAKITMSRDMFPMIIPQTSKQEINIHEKY